MSRSQITIPHGFHCEGCLLDGSRCCQAFVESQARPWHSTKGTHLEPSFHGGTNHPLLHMLLQLLLSVFVFWFYFSSFLFNSPQEGEIADHSQLQTYPLSLLAKGHWLPASATYLCQQMIANEFGVLGAHMWHPDSGPDFCFAWPSHVDREPDSTPLLAGL